MFYTGQYYACPPLCKSFEKLWLKRKPQNRWVFQQKYHARVCEWEEYYGDDLLDVLEGTPLADEVTIDDLLEMGWYHPSAIVSLYEEH